MAEKYTPSIEDVKKANKLFETFLGEKVLYHLFQQLYPLNNDLLAIFVKCTILNAQYSTHIFSIESMAKHIQELNIDKRLQMDDFSLVSDIANVSIKGKNRCFYSFATKYCSWHRLDTFPLYDSYVHQMLVFFKERDGFFIFNDNDLRDYSKFVNVINHFKKFYNLQEFNAKQIDEYLWLKGKELFGTK